jgi:hypothetical protein
MVLILEKVTLNIDNKERLNLYPVGGVTTLRIIIPSFKIG